MNIFLCSLSMKDWGAKTVGRDAAGRNMVILNWVALIETTRLCFVECVECSHMFNEKYGLDLNNIFSKLSIKLNVSSSNDIRQGSLHYK